MSDKDIKDCQGVGKKGTTIVKFCKRKVSKQVLNVRKDLIILCSKDLARAYALTTEYCGGKVNDYIAWVKYFHITCQVVL